MSEKNEFTRRDFLNISGIGLWGLLRPEMEPRGVLFNQQQGRVIYDKITIHQGPSFDSPEIRLQWKDSVLPIKKVTVGARDPAHNRIWYRVNGGYAHSGGIQPVRTILNPIVEDLPSEGALAEVTVPYTDAYWAPGAKYRFAYRFYYQTTHWVTDVRYTDAGEPYYHILEDKWDLEYFVPAPHMRIVPHEELSLISPHVPGYAKRIEVHTDQQVVIAYEWNQPVYMVKASTGADFSTGNYLTPPGRHITNYKRPSRHMAAGNLAFNGYDLPGVPWISYITENGVALHGTYWHNDFGKPRSHGCINLPSKAAKWFYRWTLPHVPPHEQKVYDHSGTAVDVLPEP